ncbi:MAG: phosphoribosylaminoimidazolesuccinocarboxamide synthase [Verrucomicrobiota bacterium]
MHTSGFPLSEAELLGKIIEKTDCRTGKVEGKVRDIYRSDNRIALVCTDRLSAFDRSITTIPLKGRILNLLSAWWFRETEPIIENHLISVPHPNVTIAEACKPIPLEFVVRGYLTGSTSTSLWTHYSEGARNYCGNIIPDGLRKNDELPQPILTPTTKAQSHDQPISGEEAVNSGIVSEEVWSLASKKALELFEFGQRKVRESGFILVDTKYEMGLIEDGSLVLIDEIHTPDSSRFWRLDTLEERLSLGEEPDSVDKEFIRLWFANRCDPYHDERLPEAPPELRLELTNRYHSIYMALVGESVPLPSDTETELGTINQVVNRSLC